MSSGERLGAAVNGLLPKFPYLSPPKKPQKHLPGRPHDFLSPPPLLWNETGMHRWIF